MAQQRIDGVRRAERPESGEVARVRSSRNTKQTEAIRTVLESANRPLFAEEVFEMARGTVAGLNRATVFRVLLRLIESDFLHVVELPREAKRYELKAQGVHHYFRCDRYSRVFAVPCSDQQG